MARVKLTRDTIVRFQAGTVLEVSEEEASRLLAFGNAIDATAKEKPEKKTAKKAAK